MQKTLSLAQRNRSFIYIAKAPETDKKIHAHLLNDWDDYQFSQADG